MAHTVEPLWRPGPDRIAASAMRRFAAGAEHSTGTPLADYAALHRWSIDEPRQFWPEVARFTGLRFARDPDSVLVDGERMPGARWFVGAELNFAAALLGPRSADPAIIFGDERGRRRVLTRAELHRAVGAVAAALSAIGVGPGDRVAGFVANCPEAVVAALATASLGAIWSSCSPDFGVAGVLDRFGQIAPKVLFAVDGYTYGGKRIDTRAVVAEVAAALDSLERVVVIAFLDDAPDVAAVANAVHYGALAAGEGTVPFAPRPFDHPVYIVYSSGTTGAPKCIVHGAGGVLLQHLKEHVLHTDVGPGDRLFYFTTCGWMMWNWQLGALAAGAAIVLYDGSPFHPDPGVLWRLAEREGVTVFGTSAKYLAALAKSGFRPGDACKLGTLKAVLSTGSPLAPETFDFAYAAIRADMQLASISGGTDILSCFALGNPALPVYRGELQCLGLGMAVEIFDDGGQAVQGARGELVCTRPFPSMPLGFWGDADGSRYRDAYFARYPGVWAHGDYAELTPRRGLVIHGRSDAVLNPGGVRIGTAEIYRQVEKLDAVLESVAVAQPWQDDERVVLFVVLRDGHALDDALRARIRDVVRRNASPRHVPAKILAVPELPRTRSGKLVELAVRAAIRGEPIANTLALANPEALDAFRNRPELDVD